MAAEQTKKQIEALILFAFWFVQRTSSKKSTQITF
jgi:hypothetical protein